MAADNSAVAAAHQVLVADTEYVVNLTGGFRRIEIVHHGVADDGTTAVTTPVYFTTDVTEAGLTAAVEAADETGVVLAGERLTQGCQKGDTWVSLISAGTPMVSIIGIRSQDG